MRPKKHKTKRQSAKDKETLAHKPKVLYLASLERIEEAQTCRDSGHCVAAMYLGGLAVECILQALALRDNPQHDARHDLTKWLSRCPRSLEETLKSDPVVAGDWNRVDTVWYNGMRYLSENGLLGYLRGIDRAEKDIKGGREAILKENAKRLVDSASAVHKKGLATWRRF